MEKARVYLVGAGPGDPELLTVKAARLISTADVVVHDGLVDDAIMALINPSARLISVAKRRSRHSVPQDGINDILVREAKIGRVIVRLGDPADVVPAVASEIGAQTVHVSADFTPFGSGRDDRAGVLH